MSDQDVKRTIKGRRPQFHDDPAVDQLHGMVMAMATEMAVLYERIDTMERIAGDKGVMLREELARYRPDPGRSAGARGLGGSASSGACSTCIVRTSTIDWARKTRPGTRVS